MVTPSILITDDDEAFRETLRSMLEPCGYELATAADDHEALQIVRRQRVDLLLLDLHMPRMSGLETASALQTQNLRKPWILISAGLNDELQEQARRLHAFSALTKPVTRDVLAGTVREALLRYYG